MSIILVFMLMSVLGCVDDYKETKDISVNTLDAQKKEAEEVHDKIDKVKEAILKENKQEHLKELEEQEAKLLEKSKEIEEKIKELQQKENKKEN